MLLPDRAMHVCMLGTFCRQGRRYGLDDAQVSPAWACA